MAKGFFKERKHYTLQNIADILYEKENADLEETRRLVGILKKYGVVKAVKRTKPEFDDLSNEDIVLTDVVDNSSDIEYVFDYVGVNVVSFVSVLLVFSLYNGKSTIAVSSTLPKFSAHTFSHTKLKLFVPYRL